MAPFSILETIILATLGLMVIWWWGRGLNATMARSKEAPADWPAVLMPVGWVIAFVIFLILTL